jgi:hypothetical protein
MLEFVKIILAKIVLDFGRVLVHFGPNLFAIKMAPIFVILVADMSFLPTSLTSQAQLRSPHIFARATQGKPKQLNSLNLNVFCPRESKK